jgi:hypothetical protein
MDQRRRVAMRRRFFFALKIFFVFFQMLHQRLTATHKRYAMIIQRYLKNGYGVRSAKRTNFQRRRASTVDLDLHAENLFTLTGVPDEVFWEIYNDISPRILTRGKIRPVSEHRKNERSSSTALTTPSRVAAVLAWIKHHPDRVYHASKFKVSWKTLYVDRKFLLPIVAHALFSHTKIDWPVEDPTLNYFSWAGAALSVDCTTHCRVRVRPSHNNYYRGDKHCCFLSAQVFCDLAGSKIFGVDLCRGHSNDQG